MSTMPALSPEGAKLYRVCAAPPPKVAGHRVVPGQLLTLLPQVARSEVEFGHLVETTVEAEAQPLDLTDAERAALPPLGDGPAEPVLGQAKNSAA